MPAAKRRLNFLSSWDFDMSKSDRPLISHDHLYLFGGITHLYAMAELNLKFVLAGILKVDLSTIMILTEPYSSHQLRNVLSSLIKNPGVIPKTLGPKNYERLVGLIGQFKSFGALRNNIAHNHWTAGKRPGSIKPMRLDIQSGKAKHIGVDDTEKDYTVSDLRKEAESLEKLQRGVYDFFDDTGLREIIEEKMEESKIVIESSAGNSDKKP